VVKNSDKATKTVYYQRPGLELRVSGGVEGVDRNSRANSTIYPQSVKLTPRHLIARLFRPLRDRYTALRLKFRIQITKHCGTPISPAISLVRQGYSTKPFFELLGDYSWAGCKALLGGGRSNFFYAFSFSRRNQSHLTRILNIWTLEGGNSGLVGPEGFHSAFTHHYSHFIKSYRSHRRNFLLDYYTEATNHNLYRKLVGRGVERQNFPFIINCFSWYQTGWERTISPYLRNLPFYPQALVVNPNLVRGGEGRSSI
jgi:hypothetical protein